MFLAPSRRAVLNLATRRSAVVTASRSYASTAATGSVASRRGMLLAASAAATAGLVAYNNNNTTGCVPRVSDITNIGKITKEPATGIAFPELCNGMTLAGVGVRIKYVFVKVYGVGAYFDPIAMMAVKKGTAADIEKALLDPTYPR